VSSFAEVKPVLEIRTLLVIRVAWIVTSFSRRRSNSADVRGIDGSESHVALYWGSDLVICFYQQLKTNNKV